MKATRAMRLPLRILPACALVFVSGLSFAPRALAQAAQAPVDDAAPAKLGPWTWDTTPAHLRIAAALREARHAGPNDGPLLQQRIIGSGKDSVAAQVDILLRSRVPETSPKDGPQVLSDAQRELLLSSMAKMPLKAVRKELDARLALTPDDVRARLGCMQALSVIGEAKDLARLVELAPRKQDSTDLALPYSSRETLRDSTAALLHRLPQAWPEFGTTLRKADPSAAKSLLDALACARDPRALRVLLDAVRNDPKLSWKAASLVAACGPSLSTETNHEFLEWMRNEFQGATPDYRRTLLMAVGTLDDGDWVPLLADKLEDEDTGVREESLSALQKISGLGFPGDPALWRSWNEGEERWHAQQRPKLLQELADPESPKVLAAVREYSEHRTHRAAMSEELLDVLRHGRPEVRCMVISVLERLGSPVACSALLGMLNDSDPKVAEAAWQALHTISGIEISRDPEELQALFGRS